VKEEEELVHISRAAGLARKIMGEIEIKAGKSEQQIAGELRIAALEKGAEASFPPIVLAGANARVPHGIPGRKKIGMNEAVLVDFGVRHGVYCSDISRCFFTGACKEERGIYEKLRQIHDELLDACRAGLQISQFVKKSTLLFKKSHLPPPPHLTGHGIGLEVHEHPRLHSRSRQRFKDGMVLAIEPSFYGKKFGLRYENDWAIRGGRARVL